MRTEEYTTLVRLIRELASEVRNVKTGLDSKIDHVAKKVTEAFSYELGTSYVQRQSFY